MNNDLINPEEVQTLDPEAIAILSHPIDLLQRLTTEALVDGFLLLQQMWDDGQVPDVVEEESGVLPAGLVPEGVKLHDDEI